MPKPGLIRTIIISWRIERITAGELALQTYLKRLIDELSARSFYFTYESDNNRFRYLLSESKKTTDKIKVLQDKKKDLYFKFL